MKKYYLVLIVIVALIAFLIPFLFTDKTNQILNVSGGLLSTVSSIITLLIALILFDKYGLRKTIKDKQSDLVLGLIEDLKRVRVFIEGQEGFIQYRPLKNWQTFYEKNIDKQLVFNINYWEGSN